ncbi:MAG TPA: efflux RND transporter periplasmic adaptor subunit [Candidatus Binatia bacterium]|nr:efflux RND transporter periplasmic adaptor subunit [Candidatus Binatia bacterium]
MRAESGAFVPGRAGRRAFVLAAVALAAASCRQEKAPPRSAPKVVVSRPVERDVTEWDEYTARLEAIEFVEVRPRVSGYLQSVDFREGAIVQKGTQLVQIDARPYEAVRRRAEGDLAVAKARLDLARKKLERAMNLVGRDAISREEADTRAAEARQAEASLEAASAAVDAARLDVEFTQVRAPIAGRVGRRLVTEGNLVNGGSGTQGTLITTIVSLDPIHAIFEADEQSFLKYQRLARTGERASSREVRNPVQVGLADEEGFPHQGYMDFVDNQLDPATGTIIGRAILPNPDLSLTPGLFARLRLPGRGDYRTVLLPDEAIQSDQAKKYVLVVDDRGVAQYRAISTGPLIQGLRVVRDGVGVDDRVIVSGLQRVRPGVAVDAEEKPLVQQARADASPLASPADEPRALASPAAPARAGGRR